MEVRAADEHAVVTRQRVERTVVEADRAVRCTKRLVAVLPQDVFDRLWQPLLPGFAGTTPNLPPQTDPKVPSCLTDARGDRRRRRDERAGE
jgi:hypothetical protein